MNSLQLRPTESCAYDVVALGEVMLRLDPGEGRVRTTRQFAVSEGGGEYNVARALRRCFGHRAAVVTAVTDNEIGALLEDLLLQGGVTVDHVVRKRADPVGRMHRVPLNFTERGLGPRPSVGVYDRAHSAAAAMTPDDVDWEHLFGTLGVRWLHTGGIFAGLSESTLDVVRAAIAVARSHGTIVSYDINHRPSLWAAAGGPDAAWAVTEGLLDGVDVLFGVDSEGFAVESERLMRDHPGLAVVATTERTVHDASRHDLGAVARVPSGLVAGPELHDLGVLDRVGSGDGFAAGVIHGLLDGRAVDEALGLGVGHGALVMTTPGDTSMATLAEVEALLGGAGGAIRR